ncbi:MAG: hypothetical protein OWS74_00860, partial [Firmicutes bacterium]|nr:hypothetical protein [Bacillota bacterium]
MTDALALIHRLFWPQANDPYATVHTLRMLDQTMRNTIADSVTDIAGAWRRRYSVLNAQARGAVSVDRPIGHSAALLSTLRQYKAWADKFSEASSRLHTLPMAASDAA